MIEKEVKKLDDSVTRETYSQWFSCFSQNASVYMPEFLKTMENKRRQTELEVDKIVESKRESSRVGKNYSF